MPPADKIFSALCDITDAITKLIAITETPGKIFVIFCVIFEKNLFAIIPSITGTKITFIMPKNNVPMFVSTVVLKIKYVINGVKIGDNKVFTLVMHTDRATSPFDK